MQNKKPQLLVVFKKKSLQMTEDGRQTPED